MMEQIAETKEKARSTVIQVGNQQYYMDGFLQIKFSIAKKAVLNDWDMIFVVDGYEGTGKSVLAQQAAYYCDPTITCERIVFSPQEFIKAVKSAEKYQAIVYDEAFGGMMARRSMNYINIVLMEMLAEIRQKNLFIFLVLPCFFELDKYAAVWRSRALIHVYDKNFERGRFSFYGRSAKKRLWLDGKKDYSYKTKASFHGKFTKHYVVDEAVYRQKKLAALQMKDSKRKTERDDRMTKWLYSLVRSLDIEDGMNLKDIASKMGVSYRTLNRFVVVVGKHDVPKAQTYG